MHPFTSLTLWALAACTTLLLPAQTVLPLYSAATFLCLLAQKSTRRRAKYVAWLMLSLGVGLWLVHGGWLTEWISGQPRAPQRWIYAVTLWLRLLAIVSTSQLWMQYVPVQRFIRALFASRLPPGIAYLFAGPLLVVEQLKRQLAIVHEAQRARGVPLDEGWYQRLRAIPALIVPLIRKMRLTIWRYAARRWICEDFGCIVPEPRCGHRKIACYNGLRGMEWYC